MGGALPAANSGGAIGTANASSTVAIQALLWRDIIICAYWIRAPFHESVEWQRSQCSPY